MTDTASLPVHLAQCANCGGQIVRSAGRNQRTWRHAVTGTIHCLADTLAEPIDTDEDGNLTDADLIEHLRLMANQQRDGILAVCALRMERLAAALTAAEAQL